MTGGTSPSIPRRIDTGSFGLGFDDRARCIRDRWKILLETCMAENWERDDQYFINASGNLK